MRPVKQVNGQSVEDDSSVDEKFKIIVFYELMNKVNQSMNVRFSYQTYSYLDLACFNSQRFPCSRKVEYLIMHLTKFIH